MGKVLSIIVPLYNSSKWLPKCLNSLLNQDIPAEAYEILLINDGSPDDSKTIADEYAADHNNIRVFSKENGGTSSARNVGIRNAEGKYLYFVDPDDYILESSLNTILLIMEEKDLDVLRFGYTEVDEQGIPTRSCKHPEQPDYSSKVMDGFSFMAERLGTACFVWTYLFRTALIQENQLYFDEKAYIDDTPWLPRVLALSQRVDSIDMKRHFYTIRSGSLVRAGKEKADKIIDAQKWLINELYLQMNQVGNKNAVGWYNKMIAHTALSLFSLVATSRYARNKEVTTWVKQQNIMPFSSKGSAFRTRLKLHVINLSPSLFCTLIHRFNP